MVSEERGEVTLAISGEIEKVDSPELLSERLTELLSAATAAVEKETIRDRLLRNFWPKMVTVGVVLVCWLIITVKQGGIVSVTVPIKFHNLPDDVVLLKSVPEDVEVQLNVFSSLIPSPRQLDIVADINLAKLREGASTLPIRTDDFKLPLGVVITSVKPSSVRIHADRKVRKELRVKVKVVGHLQSKARVRRLMVEPEKVTVEGPSSALGHLEDVETEVVDLSTLNGNEVVEKQLQRPAPMVSVLHEGQVKVRVITMER
jgi:YbbR domain-containing protein